MMDSNKQFSQADTGTQSPSGEPLVGSTQTQGQETEPLQTAQSSLDKNYTQDNIPRDQINQNNPVSTMGASVQSKNKAPLLIVLGVVGVACVLGFLFIPNLLGANYSSIANKFEAIDALMISITSCTDVRNNVDSSTTDAEMYDSEISTCKEAATRLYEQLNEVEQMVSRLNDSEIQELFNAYKSALDVNLPNPSELDSVTEKYRMMHNLNIALDNLRHESASKSGFDVAVTKDEMTSAIDAFVNSDIEEYVEFGNQLSQLYSNVCTAWQQYESTYKSVGDNFSQESNNEAENNFYNAYNSFSDYTYNMPDISAMYTLGNDDNGEITNPYVAFKDAVNKKL